MRNQKGYVAGDNGQLVVTAQQVIVGAVLSQHLVDRTLLPPVLKHLPPAAGPGRDAPQAAPRMEPRSLSASAAADQALR